MAPPAKTWWLDSDQIVLYHGTHLRHLDSIRENGIQAPAWLTPSFETAKGYCVFCLKGTRDCWSSGKLFIPRPQDMVVISAHVPRDFVLEHSIYDHPPGILNTSWNLHKKRLADRTMFDAFTGTSEQYYEWTECRFDEGLPAEYLGEHCYPYIGK